MPCPHFEINIVKRSTGGSAVNAAAYQAGEKIYSERERKYMYHGTKEELVLKEILLPPHAPPDFKDRKTLWNSAEAAEPNWNSQLARRMKITLPRELSLEENIALAREYCQKEFVDKGMIADLAVHDPAPPNHNPHFHVLLTMRPMDENGNWAPKSHKEYMLDKDGNRIFDENGKPKKRKVAAVDWNERGNAEMWRHDWEVLQNQYLERAGRPERVCMKSYERQGIDQIPTVHMGPAATALERKGIWTDAGNLNREIRTANELMTFLKATIRKLAAWLSDIRQAIREIEMEPEEVFLVDLLTRKFDERANERFLTWHNERAAGKAHQADFKRFVSIVNYMKRNDVLTVEDLEKQLSGVRDSEETIRRKRRKAAGRMNEIDRIRATVRRRSELDPIHDKYTKMYLGKKRYGDKHKDELEEWRKCNRYLYAKFQEGKCDMKALSSEHAMLERDMEEMEGQLPPIMEELDMLRDIQWLVKDLLPELKPERKEIPEEKKEERRQALTPKREEPKSSVLERLNENKTAVQARGAQKEGRAQRPGKKQFNIGID